MTDERIEVLGERADGSNTRGIRLPFAADLYAAGTPPLRGLARERLYRELKVPQRLVLRQHHLGSECRNPRRPLRPFFFPSP